MTLDTASPTTVHASADAGSPPAERARTLGDLLAKGLAARPDAAALIDTERSYSFRDLHERANAIAEIISERYGVRRGDRVVVLAEKSPAIVAVAVACWRIGALYVPLDADNPPRRLESILASVEPVLVVSSARALDGAQASLSSHAQLTYEACLELEPRAQFTPREAVDPADPGLIIHTSGSTGTPKGVVLSHGSIVTYLHNHNDFLGFDTDSVGINNGPFYFDVSVQDTFLPLYFGASVVLHRGLWVSAVMIALLKRHGVTHLIAVSSVLELISKDVERLGQLSGGRLKVVVTGGEVCAPRLINRWLDMVPGLRVLYGYGPTEVNSLCTTQVITEAEPERIDLFSIGKPFRGHTAILLDERRQVIDEPRVVGTLAVTGPQLMLGYWRDPELTERAMFVRDGVRFYVTGDRCYRDADGNLHFEGRTDAEVKIRGRRINLNEVRNALAASVDVSHAVVTTADVAGETRIVAAANINATDDADDATEQRVRAWLGSHVPEYMQPWSIVAFTQTARTGTDKVDERRMKARLLELVAAHPEQRWLSIAQ